MGKAWTNSEQAVWLNGKLPDYVKAKAEKNKGDFLLLVRKEWFEVFPERKAQFPLKPEEEALSTDEEAVIAQAINTRTAQIDGWFEWRSRTIKRSRTSKPVADPTSLRSLIDAEGAKHPDRAPQRNEVYLRLYADKVKAVYESEEHSNITNPGIRVNRLKAIAQELLDNDTDEVKKIIGEEIQKWKKEKADGVKGLDVPGEDLKVARTPEEYQSALKRLPTFLAQVMDPLVNATGWTFTVLCGGPFPAENGRPCGDHYHFGPKSPAGKDFSEAYSGFQRHVMYPYTQHVLNVFPMDIRNQRSLGLPPKGTDTNATPPAASVVGAQERLGEKTSAGTDRDGAQGNQAPNTEPVSAGCNGSQAPNSDTTAEDTRPSPSDVETDISSEEEDDLHTEMFSYAADRPSYNTTTAPENETAHHVAHGIGLDPTARSEPTPDHVEHTADTGERHDNAPLDLTPEHVKQSALEPQAGERSDTQPDTQRQLKPVVLPVGGAIDPALQQVSSPPLTGGRDAMDTVTRPPTELVPQALISISPSRTTHPGGPTEPLAHAMERDAIHHIASPSIPTVDIQAENAVIPEVDLDQLLGRSSSTEPTQSSLGNSLDTFVYNQGMELSRNLSTDYTIPGTRLDNSGSKSTHDTSTDNSAIAQAATGPVPEPKPNARIKKRTRAPSNANVETATGSAPGRVSLRQNRKTATFGPVLVSDPTAPRKKVKHSWSYASDTEQ